MTMETVYTWGLNRDSCTEALIARKRFGIKYPGAGQKYFYEWGCEDGGWLIWQLMQIELSDELKQALQRALIKIADRAVRNYALNSPKASIRKWAEDWLSGKDRSHKSAREAETAATAVARKVSRAEVAKATEAEVAKAAKAAKATGAAAWAAEAAREVESAELVSVKATDAAAWAAIWATQTASQTTKISGTSITDAKQEAKQKAIKKELKLQTIDIRSEIPEWPGE